MKLKLTFERSDVRRRDDLLVTVDTTVTVGDLAGAIARRDPQGNQQATGEELTLRVAEGAGGGVLMADATVSEAGLRSGQTVSITTGGGRYGDAPAPETAAATLVVEAGPDVGKRFPLRRGSNQIGRGRGNDATLTDPQVSKSHARVNVGDSVEVIDLGSSNGTHVEGDLVSRSLLRTQDRLQFGDTVVRVELHGRANALSDAGTYEFNRAPRIDVVFEGEELEAPAVPKRFRPARLPIIPLIAPVLLGCIMFAVTRQLVTILFVALSPVMMLGNVIENRVFGRREQRRAEETFLEDLVALRAQFAAAAEQEVLGRRREHPSTAEVVAAAEVRSPVLWSYQPDQRGFLDVRLGLGRLPARTSIALGQRGEAAPGMWERLLEVRDDTSTVEGVPVTAELRSCGSLGIAGARSSILTAARSALAQLVGLHSPADLVVAAVVPSVAVDDWDWLKWLPHVGSEHSPLTGEHLASGPGSASRLVSQLEDLVVARLVDDRPDAPAPTPAVLMLVEDDAPVERSRLVELAARGRRCGVHLLWLAGTVGDLPAPCRTYLELDRADQSRGRVGHVDGGTFVEQVAVEGLALEVAQTMARGLSPVVDAGARVDDDSDLPRSVSMVALTGTELTRSGEAVVDRWRTSGSLPARAGEVRRSSDAGLRAQIGAAAGQTMMLDLREHGPHALVGGTTGSGKSEFLQSWVMGMALEHSPTRITFLFVDYKGGAAFSDCVELPHSVGLVTDLSPHLVRRALTSLNAELRHREHVLQAKKAKDLIELERRGDPEAPPSLVIVVDEFAALVSEVPEFVDGVVNVAQRGRSLGLHLILATQRPAGVIKDNLRANTNLRVALRMADESDSTDVVGTPQAAGFDPSIPGRGVVKTGPGRLVPFQAAYVGGWTSDTPPPPIITIEQFVFGGGDPWVEPDDGDVPTGPGNEGPNDLQRLVQSVRSAQDLAGLDEPRRPWLDVLAPVYDLARLPQSRTDADLVFGILDDPEGQVQVPVSFQPDRDGNMIVYGTGGVGKSAFLRTLGIVAGLGLRGGPCHVFGLDFGARGLQMLEPLPHVGSVIPGDDDERVQRLLRQLRTTIDERAVRYSACNAASIDEFRERTDTPDEPRILVLVDNVGSFRQSYEVGPNARYWDLFQAIAADGRQVGVHMVVSADRPTVIPSGLASVIQRRLVLRLASENDLTAVGVPTDVFGTETTPGRGFMDGREVQVAVLGGSPNTSRQAAAISRLAEDLQSLDRVPAQPVRRLPEQIRLEELPVSVDERPTLGIADDTLAPMGFVPEDILLVAGPPQSGRTSVMATIALSLQRWGPGELLYLGAGRSPLRTLVSWAGEAVGMAAVAELARSLSSGLSDPDPSSLLRAIFLEDLSSYNNSEAEIPLQDLLKAARGAEVLVVTDADSTTMAAWPLQAAAKAPRHGIVLQPDQFDGDNLFKTPLPKVSRTDFPPGRGFYIRAGVARRVQCALPEVTR